MKFHDRYTAFDPQELWECLESILRYFDCAFIILDALDEVDSSKRAFLPMILKSCSKMPRTKVFVTSRPNLKDMNELLAQVPMAVIGFEGNASDIEKYLDVNMPQDMQTEDRQAIKDSIKNNANGL